MIEYLSPSPLTQTFAKEYITHYTMNQVAQKGMSPIYTWSFNNSFHYSSSQILEVVHSTNQPTVQGPLYTPSELPLDGQEKDKYYSNIVLYKKKMSFVHSHPQKNKQLSEETSCFSAFYI